MAVKKVRRVKEKRDYKKEYADYQGKPGQIKNRAKRNAARKIMEKKGKVHKGDGKDVNHKRGVPAGNGAGNLSVESASKNRSFRRTKTAGKKDAYHA